MDTFKEGDLVEVIHSDKGNKGHRFVVTEFSDTVFSFCGGLKEGMTSYKSDIFKSGRYLWARGSDLKLVNPDSDSISEFTFKELIDSIGQGEVV